MAIPDPLHGPLTVGEHRSVLQTICSCREVLSPVVQRLWLQALAPRRLWSPLLAIMGIASRSKQPIMWLNCLNTRFATTYSLAAAVPAPAVADIFAPLDDGLAALGLEPTGDEEPEGQDALDVEVMAEYDRVAARLTVTFGDEVEIPRLYRRARPRSFRRRSTISVSALQRWPVKPVRQREPIHVPLDFWKRSQPMPLHERCPLRMGRAVRLSPRSRRRRRPRRRKIRSAIA